MLASSCRSILMTLNARIIDLLVQHEELQAQGKLATAEELCRDFPELLEPLRQQLGVLRAVAHVLGSRAGSTPAVLASSLAETLIPPSVAPESETLPPQGHTSGPSP